MPAPARALALLLALAPLLAAAYFVNPDSCVSDAPGQCQMFGPRDILFMLDGSASMDPGTFFGPHLNPAWPSSGPQYLPSMLDIVEELFCNLYQNQSDHTFGLGIFNHQVAVQIPLSAYTPQTFFDMVEQVRATQNTASPVCCSCCTPLAEMFDLAGAEFQKHGAATKSKGLQILYILSDGKPYQNTYGPYAYPAVNEATYMFNTVPNRALALKKKNVKVLIVAVPSRDNNPGGAAPNVAYFNGVPDPALVPNGDPRIINQCVHPSAPTCQCAYQQQRAPNKIYCTDMFTPPFPVESQGLIFNGKWEDIVNITSADAGCGTNIQDSSHAPTAKPTSAVPTAFPTSLQPTSNPTKLHPVELDLYILLDNSLSMTWHSNVCRKAPGADPAAPNNLVCWKLMLGFAQSLVSQTLALGSLTWMDQSPEPYLGLRVTIFGFSCTNQQHSPVTIPLGVDIQNQNDFDTAMANALQFIPTGGTCPGQTIDLVVNDIETGSSSQQRPTKAAVLLTDGIFYDDPRPTLAAKGLGHFCVQRFALGLPGGEKGLTQAETKTQLAQLTGFTGNDSSVYNFGVQGYSLLSTIAQNMINAIANLPESTCWANVQSNWAWCGYTSSDLCQSSGQCLWNNVNQKCYARGSCDGLSMQNCQGLQGCIWNINRGCLSQNGRLRQ